MLLCSIICLLVETCSIRKNNSGVLFQMEWGTTKFIRWVFSLDNSQDHVYQINNSKEGDTWIVFPYLVVQCNQFIYHLFITRIIKVLFNFSAQYIKVYVSFIYGQKNIFSHNFSVYNVHIIFFGLNLPSLSEGLLYRMVASAFIFQIIVFMIVKVFHNRNKIMKTNITPKHFSWIE